MESCRFGTLTAAARGSQNAPAALPGLGELMIQEHARFQLEASRLGRDHVFQVTVFEKEERRRKRYFAETQCSDPFHLVIQFIIRDAANCDELLRRFVGQLEHRGFEPRRLRVCGPAGKWQAWGPVPHLGEWPAVVPVEPGEATDGQASAKA